MCADKRFPVVVFNDDGLEVYREEANGYWVKRDYDENGRQIYWENSGGEWARHKFDKEGHTVWYANHEGFSFVAEYGRNGFRTYYEDSNGKVIGRKSVDSLVDNAAGRSIGQGRSENSAVQGKVL